jgi:membrane-associated phospholipid phosphatase
VVQSLAYAGALTTALKIVIGRHRPYLNDGSQAYDSFTGNDGYYSLPSGHTTVAFAISSSLAADIDNPYATVGLYGIAALTAVSRMYVDRHWLSDTFLGAAIGTACGYGVVHLHDAGWGDASSLYVLPTLDGVMVGWRF